MKNAFVFGVKAVLLTLALAGCSLGSTGGYNESVNSASYSVSDISYTGDAKSGDRLDISKIQITLTCVDASNSSQTYYCNPKEAYDHLKQKNVSFSLTITADGEKVISFGGDENFPETDNPFTFDAGATTISIAGAIGGNEVNSYSLVFVGEKTEFRCRTVSGIAYKGGAKVGDRLDLSNVEIALGVYFWDEQGEYQEATHTYNPQEAYAFLKSQGIDFSLSIKADDEQIISFGSADRQFPEGVPYTFKEAGEIEISISGTIDRYYEVSKSFSLKVEAKNRAESYEALLKMILGEEKYNEIKANLESNLGGDGLVLAAALIKEVGEKYPVIMTTDEHDDAVRANAAIFVAQAEKYINITKGEKRIPAVLKASSNYEEMEGWRDEYAENSVNNTVYKINEYENEISFTGSFDLREISFPENNGKGKFSEARLTYSNPIAVDNNKFYVDIEQVNKIINIKGTNETTGDSLPTLEFNDILDEVKSTEIYKLYKSYSSDLSKLDISGNLYRVAMDGREISGNNKDYTLFTDDGNNAKLSTDSTITSLTADALVQMYKQLTIYQIWNVIISGNATKEDTVNWELRNVVFEGDMHTITNNFRDPGPNGGNGLHMYGIIYFKDRPYNNNIRVFGQSVAGMLKLDSLEGVSNENFKAGFGSYYYSVFDLRNVKKSVIDNYNDKIVAEGENVHAIYFHNDFNVYKDNKEEIDKLIHRFAYKNKQEIFNVYLGDNRVNTYYYDSPNYQVSSRIPRTLKEFEYFGNTYDNTWGDTVMHFEKPAKSSYTYDEFNKLPEKESNQLNKDAETGLLNGRVNLLAKNDRRIEFIDPETQKIIRDDGIKELVLNNKEIDFVGQFS